MLVTVPRFRFAPSPTGIPHVGNLHTALFSWALARAMRGDFILRIEDTDSERNTPQAIQQMLDALTWLGIDWDEGPDVGGDYEPYIQSQRHDKHQAIVAQLLASGDAYYDDADPEQQPIRLKLPQTGQTVVQDALRGPITFENSQLKDPIIVRSNGRSLYHLAAMADDHDMGITHVVRGEEWLSSAPIHVHLYRVLGWNEPVWIHLPLILNKQGQKLSKRDPEGGYLIRDFQQAGYLPPALFNYLLLLGWSPDGLQEIVDKWTVRKQFRLERLSASPATFDWDKLNWINRQYLTKLSDTELAEQLRPFLEDVYEDLPLQEEWLVRVTAVIRDELDKLEDAVELVEWAFTDSFDYTPAALETLASPAAHPVLSRLVAEIATVVLLDDQTAHHILAKLRHDVAASHNWNATQVLHPIRAALTGDVNGPPLPQIMGIIGKQRTLIRLAAAFR